MSRRSVGLLLVFVTAMGGCGRLHGKDTAPGQGDSTTSNSRAVAVLAPVPFAKIDHVEHFRDMGVTLSPPPPDVSPGISAAEAQSNSDSTYNPGPLTTSTVSLGLLTERDKHLSQVLAWIVHYSRPCHDQTEEFCTQGVDDYKVYDAQTGDWLTTWEFTS